MNYFARQRQKELQKGKPVIIRQLKRIEFHIDDVYYTYEYRTESNSGFAYIKKGNITIYGPYSNQRTLEGEKVYNLVQEFILKQK